MAVTDTMDGSNVILQNFDRGIRSRVLSEQLDTVVSTVSLIRSNPFPLFVNRIIVRLAEAFRDGSNALRSSIARVLGECGPQLSLVFSRTELVKRLLVVTHSNDPKARALTLIAFASLAPIVHNNKQVHHVIVEGLASSHGDHFEAAVIALAALSTMSTEFSATVIGALSDRVLETATTIQQKTQLASVFGEMRTDQETTQIVFALGKQLIETETQQQFITVLLNSLTQLAISTRFAIPHQISMLLSVLSRADDVSFLPFLALRNIRRLAEHSHLWTKGDIENLRDMRSHLSTGMSPFLEVFVQLSQHPLPAHMDVFSELVGELAYLYGDEDIRSRICFLDMSVNVYLKRPNQIHRDALLTAIPSTLALNLSSSLSKRMCRIGSRFLSSPEVPPVDVVQAVHSLVALPITHLNLLFHLHMFCHLVDKRGVVANIVRRWALSVLSSPVALPRPLPRSLLAYLVYPPAGESSDDCLQYWTGNDYDKFLVARAALRNGHWTVGALPVLHSIRISSLSPQTSSWIFVLRELAASQSKEFSVPDMHSKLTHLSNAKSAIELQAKGAVKMPPFAALYIDALRSTSNAQLQLLSSLAMYNNGGDLLALRNSSKKFRCILRGMIKQWKTLDEEWAIIEKRCFDADLPSQDTIRLEHVCVSVMFHGLRCVIESPPAPLVIPPCIVECTTSVQTRNLILWAASGMQQLAGRDGNVTYPLIAHFLSVFRELYMRPVFVPRFFFQQLYTTSIKLSISPEGDLSVQRNVPIPIRVDGLISSHKDRAIHAITIIAHIRYNFFSGKDYVEKRMVTPDACFFTTQFLLSFAESGAVSFTVQFVDTERRMDWLSDATSSIRIEINDYQ